MEIGILGPLQVVDHDRRVELGAHRQRSVFAILALQPDEVVSLDRLIDLLWGSTPPNAATGSLQAYVSNLRRVLEPTRGPRQAASVLVTEPPGYRLRIEPGAIDAVRCERLASEGRRLLAGGASREAIARFDAALGLWRGEALAEFRFEAFAAADVARLDELRVATEEDRVEACLAAGDTTGVLPDLERLIARHPLRERLRGLQMLALYRSGRQAEALRAYDDIRRVLADELGLDPGAHLQALLRQVLEQDSALDAGSTPPSVEIAAVAAGPSSARVRLQAPAPGSFVGRADTLAVMDDALEDALSGRTRVVLLGGEPGIGKTRVAEEVCRRAAAGGATAAWGRCHDDVGMPPLWPWEQILRATGDSSSDAVTIERLVESDVDPLDPVLPDVARFRLYGRVRDVLERRSSAAPLVLVLDDLQWADTSSLRLLRYLAVELTTARVLVVATFQEPAPAHVGPLTAALADLARQDRVDRLALGPLTVGDVSGLVRAAVATADAVEVESLDDVARDLHRRTDGNAFFVTELVRLLLSERALPSGLPVDVPVAIGDVVRRRLARLPEDVQALLAVASVIGREFELDLLARVAGLGADEAVEILEAAVMARAVLELRAGRYRFSHGLVHETLSRDLQPGRRGRLHLRVAEAIEAAVPADVDERISRLAHHFAAGGASAAAARYAELAADEAERSLAYDEAAAHWQAALDAMGESIGPDTYAAIARLLLRLAAALVGAGDAAGSERAHARALDAAEASGDAMLLAEAAFAYGEIDLWQVRPYGSVDERLVGAISRALELLPEDDPLHGRLLVALAIALYYREDARERGRELARQAATGARRTGDTKLLMQALIELVVMLEASPTLDEQLLIVDELESLLRADPPFSVAATAMTRIARVRLAAGDGRQVEAQLDELWREGVQRRNVPVELWATWARTGIAFIHGRLAEAEQLAAAAFALHQRTGIWGAPETYALHVTMVWREQARLVEVAPLVEPLLRDAEYRGGRKLLALFALARGAIDEIAPLLGEQAMPPLHDFIWLTEMCVTAELAAAARLDCTEDLYRSLLPFDGVVATMDGPFVCLGAVSHYLGLLADACGRREDASRHLEAAIELNDRVDAVPWAVRSRLQLALLLDDPDRARALLEEALRTAERHDLVASCRRLRELLDQ